MTLAAVVMASGFSSRMGENKLLMPYKGRPVIQYVLEAVQGAAFKYRVVVTCHEPVAELARQMGFEAVHNPVALLGQSQSVILGTKAVMQVSARDGKNVDGAMYFAGDMPFLSTSSIHLLQHDFAGHKGCIIRPVYGENARAGNPVIFPCSLFDQLCAISGDAGGRQVIAAHPELVRNVEICDEKQGVDIDSPKEALRWLT